MSGAVGSSAYGLAQAAGSAGPIAGMSARAAFVLIAGIVLAIAVVAVVPLIMDVRRATAWRRELTDRLIDRAATDEEVRDFLRDLREPRGVRGLTRSIIAVLILALVGFALAVAMLSGGADSGDLRKTIVTSLMTVLATVAGFYFGQLGAQNSAEDARRHAVPGKVLRKLGEGAESTGAGGAGAGPAGGGTAVAGSVPAGSAGDDGTAAGAAPAGGAAEGTGGAEDAED